MSMQQRIASTRPHQPIERLPSRDDGTITMPPFSDHSPDVGPRITDDLRRLTAWTVSALGSDLRTLLLAGGYARGEGGVVHTPGGFRAYNDYDLVAIVDRGAERLRAMLTQQAMQWSREVGVHVDLWAIDAERLARPPRTLFWLDVALGGGRVLHGDPRVLTALASLTPRLVPIEEAGRLLANRAVGLALSELPGAYAMPAVRARHIHKAVLAVGDARLLAANRYPGTQRKRLAELIRLAGSPGISDDLLAAYADALVFRARPDLWAPPLGATHDAWYRAQLERVARWHFEFEAFRVGAPSDPLEFASWSGKLYPHLPDVRPGAGVVRSFSAARRGVAPLLPWLGHPRERLARVAVLLAYASRDPAARDAAARLLGASSGGRDDELRERLLTLMPWGS
jgi:hypothetical protein